MEALDRIGEKTSGTAAERISRLVDRFAPPTEVLQCCHIDALRELARDVGLTVSGSKDEVIVRIVTGFARSADLVSSTPDIPDPPEPKELSAIAFVRPFSEFSSLMLSDILRGFPDLRQSGSKEQRVATLWLSPKSETTLLQELTSSQLEEVLSGLGLRINGAKGERMARLLEWASSDELFSPLPATNPDGGPADEAE